MRIDMRCSAVVWMTFAATLGVATVAEAQASAEFHGLTKPERVVDVTTKSDRHSGLRRKCWLYETWVVVLVEQVGEQYPTQKITVRKRHASSIAKLCRAEAKGDLDVPTDGQPVVGVIQDFLVLGPEDWFGDMIWFAIQDMRTGERLFESVLSGSAGLTLTPKGDSSVSVQFKKRLDESKCNPSDSTCWTEMTHDLLRDSSFTWKPPQCPVSLAFQSFVPVHIDDIRHPVVTPEPGEASCSEQP